MTGEVEERVSRRFREAEGRADLSGLIDELVAVEAPLLHPRLAGEVARRVRSRVIGLGPLDDLLSDDTVTDVLVNGPGAVWVEREGVVSATEVVLDAGAIGVVIERALAPLGLRVDRARPVADGRLPDGSRISVVLPPLAPAGPLVAIRRFVAREVDLAEVCGDALPVILEAVTRRANVVVFGSTGSGKTTLINSVGRHFDPDERVVTVEDALELRLPGRHIVQLEGRPANAEGAGAVGIRQLVRAALRLRPDRLIVGEVRGPEALDMVWAMASGHDGSFTTVHAGSPLEALSRLETFVLLGGSGLPHAAVRSQLGLAVDLLVGVERVGDGRRVVSSVSEVRWAGGDLEVAPLVGGAAR